VPAIGGLVAFFTYRLFYSSAALHLVDLDSTRLDLPANEGDLAFAASDLLARLAWGLTGMVFLIAWFVSVVVLFLVIRQALTDTQPAVRWLITVLALVISGGVLSLNAGRNPLTLPSVLGVLERAIDQMKMSDIRPFIYLFPAMGLAAAVLMVFAASSCLARPGRGEETADRLNAQQDRLRRVLYAGAAVTAAGVIHAAALHHLPVVLLQEADAEAFGEIARGVSASVGSVWSILLMGIYLPAAWVLNGRAGVLMARKTPSKEAGEARARLEATGLHSPPIQIFARYVALMGPLLAGGSASTLIDLFLGN
jgi:hypothetical protein